MLSLPSILGLVNVLHLSTRYFRFLEPNHLCFHVRDSIVRIFPVLQQMEVNLSELNLAPDQSSASGSAVLSSLLFDILKAMRKLLVQPPSQHAHMNVQLPSHGRQALTHCSTRMLVVHHPYELSPSLRSHRAPGNTGTDKPPVLTPNDEPSQVYQDSCVHSARTNDDVVPPRGHAPKARWHQLSIPCSLCVMRRSHQNSGSREALDGTISRHFPSGEHDLTYCTARRFSQPPSVTAKLPSMAASFSNWISPARP